MEYPGLLVAPQVQLAEVATSVVQVLGDGRLEAAKVLGPGDRRAHEGHDAAWLSEVARTVDSKKSGGAMKEATRRKIADLEAENTELRAALGVLVGAATSVPQRLLVGPGQHPLGHLGQPRVGIDRCQDGHAGIHG